MPCLYVYIQSLRAVIVVQRAREGVDIVDPFEPADHRIGGSDLGTVCFDDYRQLWPKDRPDFFHQPPDHCPEARLLCEEYRQKDKPGDE